MKVKIRRLDQSVELPKYQTPESAAFDLASSEDCIIAPGEIRLVKTGLVVEAPSGYFLLVASRSSLPMKKELMLSNGIGVVDRDYSGPADELMIQVYNFKNKPVEVKRGERLAQGIFLPVNQVEWEEASELRSESRGGYGSTGGYHA